MYRHMVDECLKRAREELALYQMYHRTEEIQHVQRRIDSLLRLREKSPRARFQIAQDPAKPYKPAMSYEDYMEIMKELEV